MAPFGQGVATPMGFHQIILKSPQKKTAMTFETDAHLWTGI